MYTISSDVENTIIINKSKFICCLIKINNVDDISYNLLLLKNKYSNATHYCYSYILKNIKGKSDDGEPSGTAGMPILNVLENKKLDNILCVVIRYFGSIKLGAGGLVRAYTKAVTEALDKTEIKEIKECFKVTISFNYDNIKYVDNTFKDNIILDKSFNDKVFYTILVPIEDEDKILNFNIIKKENILF